MLMLHKLDVTGRDGDDAFLNRAYIDVNIKDGGWQGLLSSFWTNLKTSIINYFYIIFQSYIFLIN